MTPGHRARPHEGTPFVRQADLCKLASRSPDRTQVGRAAETGENPCFPRALAVGVISCRPTEPLRRVQIWDLGARRGCGGAPAAACRRTSPAAGMNWTCR
jgi:hypothetical protein